MNPVALRAAILGRTPIAIVYDNVERHICPHMLGRTKDDKLVMHAFQFGGGSSAGPVTPETGLWKFYYLDKVTASCGIIGPWYPVALKKAGDVTTYNPPKFVVEVLAIAP